MRRLLLAIAFPLCLWGQGTPIATGTWTQISPHGAPFQVYSYDKLSYAPGIDAHCIWGGYHQTITSERNDALGCYSYSQNRWIVLTHDTSFHTDSGGGMGHAVSVQFADPVTNSLYYVVDGSGSNAQEDLFGHFWQYDLGGLTPRDVSIQATVARPWLGTGTVSLSMVYDSVNTKGFLFPDGNGHGQVWNPATNVWTQSSTTGEPPALQFASMEFDADTGLVYIFGGTTGSASASLYTYNVSTDTWSTLTPSCVGSSCTGSPSAPPARQAACLVYSHTDSTFLMAGGVVSLSGGSPFTDTWLYSPSSNAWTQQSPASAYPSQGSGNSIFERCSYDSTSNAVVMVVEVQGSNPYADGSWTSYATAIYAYPISAALNYGRNTPTYTPPSSGALARVTPTATSNSALGAQAFIHNPAIAATGITIYAGDAESGTYFDSTTGGVTFHGVIQSTPNSGSWTQLGTQTALDSEAGGAVDGGYELKLAYINGALWAADEKWNNSGLPAQAYAKYWTGSAWSGGAVGCYVASGCTSGNTQRPEALIGVGTAPVLAVVDNDHAASYVGGQYLYVTAWGGASWSQLAAGKLNNNATLGSRVDGACLATDGTNVWAFWDEELGDPADSNRALVTANAQLFGREWNGSSWSSVLSGSNLNVTAASWVGKPSCTYLSSVYVAWTERAAAGNPLLYVGSWNGTTMTVLGGTYLNIASGGWAAEPSVFNDGTNVYVAWEEQAALGSHSLGHAKRWNGSSWSAVGSAFAADTTNGSVSGMTCAMASNPTCVWAETSFGNLTQSYIQQYRSGAWQSVGIPPTITTASLPNGSTLFAYSAGIGTTGSPTCSLTSGALPSGISLSGCAVSGTPAVAGAASFTVTATNGAGSVSQAYSVNVTGGGPASTLSGGFKK